MKQKRKPRRKKCGCFGDQVCTACMERFLLVADGMVRQSTMQALREKYGAGKWEAE